MDAEIYLDNNATTKSLPEVRQAMLAVLGDQFGNPSSVHSAGERGREHLRAAREAVASLIGVDPGRLLFASSGTEANNLVFLSAIHNSAKRKRIVTTQVEHSSILKMCEYLEEVVEVVRLGVDGKGNIDLKELEEAITPETCLVSVQWVNNETGVIQPVGKIAEICRSRRLPFHTDAAQAVGKLAISLEDMPIDFVSLTAHKFHGPQGAAAVYAANPRILRPMMFGGPQEHGLRAGTENVPGIVGMGKAAHLRHRRLQEVREKLGKFRDRFERSVLERVPGVKINGDTENRVCNTTNLLFSDVDGQALVARLDQEGVRCSQSSACTNQRPEPSYVLRAMGFSEKDAYSSVRFSFGEDNTFEEIHRTVEKIASICEQLRKFSARRSHLHAHKVGVN